MLFNNSEVTQVKICNLEMTLFLITRSVCSSHLPFLDLILCHDRGGAGQGGVEVLYLAIPLIHNLTQQPDPKHTPQCHTIYTSQPPPPTTRPHYLSPQPYPTAPLQHHPNPTPTPSQPQHHPNPNTIPTPPQQHPTAPSQQHPTAPSHNPTPQPHPTTPPHNPTLTPQPHPTTPPHNPTPQHHPTTPPHNTTPQPNIFVLTTGTNYFISSPTIV
ncbi:hypothetical protein Pcinc_044115 [Petrolisthes cinctipes]|uniref:Uncharacterized protein n=1 Tax=Petrolisthes cinctipes TaxID=88211 RepID=A0AAE1EH84_PETCI|nr:hypothetical protein Pcinc_044115 [Petrolisthes cinctipes]